MVRFSTPTTPVDEQIRILLRVIEEEPTLKRVLERESSMSSLVTAGCKTWITQCMRPILNCFQICHGGDMARFMKTYPSRLIAKRFKEARGSTIAVKGINSSSSSVMITLVNAVAVSMLGATENVVV
eukprot:jgi/Hompol1/4776/HPOL_003874-RA